MILTVQQLVAGAPSGLQRKVEFSQGGMTMQQSLEPVGIGSIRRALSGKAARVSPYAKYRSTISGSGWQPSGLDDIDWRGKVRIGCIAPISQQTTGAAIVPVRTARGDVSPWAHAVTPAGLVNTSVTGWTPDAVAGATLYIVHFMPLLDGYATFSSEFDQSSGNFGWSVEFEEG